MRKFCVSKYPLKLEFMIKFQLPAIYLHFVIVT